MNIPAFDCVRELTVLGPARVGAGHVEICSCTVHSADRAGRLRTPRMRQVLV